MRFLTRTVEWASSQNLARMSHHGKPEGIKRILKRLAHYEVRLLVMEATGRYEFALVEAAFIKNVDWLAKLSRFGGVICMEF